MLLARHREVPFYLATSGLFLSMSAFCLLVWLHLAPWAILIAALSMLLLATNVIIGLGLCVYSVVPDLLLAVNVDQVTVDVNGISLVAAGRNCRLLWTRITGCNWSPVLRLLIIRDDTGRRRRFSLSAYSREDREAIRAAVLKLWQPGTIGGADPVHVTGERSLARPGLCQRRQAFWRSDDDETAV
jgi:hypothetical protein